MPLAGRAGEVVCRVVQGKAMSRAKPRLKALHAELVVIRFAMYITVGDVPSMAGFSVGRSGKKQRKKAAKSQVAAH